MTQQSNTFAIRNIPFATKFIGIAAVALFVGVTKADDALPRSGIVLGEARTQCFSQVKDRVHYCEIAAIAGDKQATSAAWMSYELGYHVEQDREQALRWIKLAAERDYAWGWRQLGQRYLYGVNVPQSDTQAFQCFSKVPTTGAYYLGYLSETGRGTERNYRKALEAYVRATDKINPDWRAGFRAGMLAVQGLGIPTDENYAAKIMAWTERRFVADSRFLGMGVQQTIGVIDADSRRPDLATESQELARTLTNAEKGDPRAQYTLALAHIGGVGVKIDKAQGMAWLKRAALQGDVQAQLALGLGYLAGKLVSGQEKDPAEAQPWLRQAHSAGERRASYVLGWMTLRGIGMPADAAEGLRLMTQAAEAGVLEAQAMLAILYARGVDTPRDLAAANRWWERYLQREKELYLAGLPQYAAPMASD